MKVLLVNGSPRPEGASASGQILDKVREYLPPDTSITAVTVRTGVTARPEDLEADAIVLTFPLYVDSLPAPDLEWLLAFEALGGKKASTGVWAISNCGFYEGAQTKTALHIVRNFCVKCGLSWRGGLGIGCGGMINAVKSVPDTVGIKKPVAQGIRAIAGSVAAWGALSPAERERGSLAFDGSVRFTQFAFPRFLYILAAHSGWKVEARKNGLKVRDIDARPIAQN